MRPFKRLLTDIIRAHIFVFGRHWQELGYLLMYVTARPDMQQRRVTSWLAHHNFPHGMLIFMDGLKTDPIRQKTQHLKQLKNDVCHTLHGSIKKGCCLNILHRIILNLGQVKNPRVLRFCERHSSVSAVGCWSVQYFCGGKDFEETTAWSSG